MKGTYFLGSNIFLRRIQIEGVSAGFIIGAGVPNAGFKVGTPVNNIIEMMYTIVTKVNI